MNIIVTGGAGFIGRWVTKRLLDDGHSIWIVDNFSSGSISNISEFLNDVNLHVMNMDITDGKSLSEVFNKDIDICYHLASDTGRQRRSNDNYRDNILGTCNILEECNKCNTKLVFVSTGEVYDNGNLTGFIDEECPTKPSDLLLGSKLAEENMVMSYWNDLGMPITILRPFYVYGPYQSNNHFVSQFIKKNNRGKDIYLSKDCNRELDLLYVEDCARFIVLAGYSDMSNGHVINAGLGMGISIEEIAMFITTDHNRVKVGIEKYKVRPAQSYICNFNKANDMLGWYPDVYPNDGITKVQEWIKGISDKEVSKIVAL